MSRRTPAPVAAKAPPVATDNVAPVVAPPNAQIAPADAQTPPADAHSAVEASDAASAGVGVAQAAAENASGDQSAEADDRIEVRVLSAFDDFEPNDVVLLTKPEIRAMGSAVDTDPAAVAFAKSLRT